MSSPVQRAGCVGGAGSGSCSLRAFFHGVSVAIVEIRLASRGDEPVLGVEDVGCRRVAGHVTRTSGKEAAWVFPASEFIKIKPLTPFVPLPGVRVAYPPQSFLAAMLVPHSSDNKSPWTLSLLIVRCLSRR